MNYQTNPLNVANWNGTQFSVTLPRVKPVITVTFTTAGNCQNSPTSFYPTVTPYADSLIWNFGDGNGMNAWSPIYTYPDARNIPPFQLPPSRTDSPNYHPPRTQSPSGLSPITLYFSLRYNGLYILSFRLRKEPPARLHFSVTVTAQGGTPTYLMVRTEI